RLQSPLVGRLWLVVMLIFRILVLATVGGAVFEDEQEEFVCNTLQPGCRQTCYDRAFPVSHYRFWLFHILLLSAPPVLFVIYSMHRATSPRRGGEVRGRMPPPRNEKWFRTHCSQDPLPSRERAGGCDPRGSILTSLELPAASLATVRQDLAI
uniref:Gap junction delta-3 protein n=1 Tax=Camelus bactrianus TaxID=9837 RepID=A0A9W3EXG4_CAMBA